MAKLNSEQLQAMSSTASNNLVLAGPGTGKTTTLVARLRNLISSGVPPKQILCITFNKKAADEISKRVKKATGIDSKSFQIGTFHALANRIIRKDLAKVTPVEPEYDIWARDYERQAKVKELVNIALKQGYYGGKIDAFICWLINVVWSIPTLLLVIAISIVLGKGFWQVFIAVGLTMWVEVARVTRGEVLRVSQLPYIEAIKSFGLSDLKIMWKHILPNILNPIIIISAANFATSILLESGLSFLGIGVQPPMSSWGMIIKNHYPSPYDD